MYMHTPLLQCVLPVAQVFQHEFKISVATVHSPCPVTLRHTLGFWMRTLWTRSYDIQTWCWILCCIAVMRTPALIMAGNAMTRCAPIAIVTGST